MPEPEVLNDEDSLTEIMWADSDTDTPEDAPSRHWDEQFLAALRKRGIALVRLSPGAATADGEWFTPNLPKSDQS